MHINPLFRPIIGPNLCETVENAQVTPAELDVQNLADIMHTASTLALSVLRKKGAGRSLGHQVQPTIWLFILSRQFNCTLLSLQTTQF